MARIRRRNLEAKKTTAKVRAKRGRPGKINSQLKRKVPQFRQYFLRQNRGTVLKDKLLQIPVVVLDRCSIPQKLLEKVISSGDNMVSDGKMASISNTKKRNTKTVRRLRSNKPSSSNSLQCIQSFKITAQLNKTNSRKIDAIPLPIKTTVSMNYEHPKTTAKVRTPRERLWCLRNYDFKENILGSLYNITSSNSVFRNALLEQKEEISPRAGRLLPSTHLSLSRTASNTSLNTISNIDVWAYSETNLNIGVENRYCNMSECYSSKKGQLSFHEYDYPSKDHFLVKSDSSGYHSEQKLSDNSPTSSTTSSPKRRISNDFTRDTTIITNCRQEQSPKQSVQLSPNHIASSKRIYDFKTPKLPIFKRPPTRIKPNVTSTVIPLPRTTTSRNVMLEDNSDAISLFAESICIDLDAEDNQKNNRDIPKNSVTIPVVKNDSTNANNRKGSDIATRSIPQAPLIPIQNNVIISEPTVPKEHVKALPLLNKTTPNNDFVQTFDTSTNKISDWVASTSSPKCAANTSNILSSIKRVCNYYFKHKQCFWGDRCKFIHKLPHDFQNNLRELSEEQFQSVMKKILKYKYLFKDSFEYILMYYKENNHQQDLIYLIEHILKLDFDKTPFIKAVIEALKDMGYTFVDAISEILWTHGTKTESLMDILLLIIVEEDDCLENNWHFINKITKFRKDKLDYGVVSEILVKCTDTKNREFCENIYKDLIIKSHIELCRIDRNLVIKYINLLYYFNFIQYAEQLKQNNGINDHELTINVPEIDNQISSSDFSKSDETASCTSASKSNSSSDSSSYEDMEKLPAEQIEQTPSLEKQPTHQASEVIEEAHTFSSNYINPEDDEVLMEEEEEGQGGSEGEDTEETDPEPETNTLEKPSHFLQLDLSLQRNHNYTNSELDTYLNYVNRDLYSITNYYTTNQSSIKKSIADKEDYKSVGSERSSNQSCSESPTPSNNAELQKELSDTDIVKLVASVNKSDLPVILSLMKNSADNNLCRSFTIHMVTAIKNLLPLKAIQLIVAIFENLGNFIPHVFQAQNMKHIMKLLAFNILPFLDKRKEYGAATGIIDIFLKEIDEFIKTESIAHYEWLSSIKLRYIFIFKIFVRDRKLREALKLLKNSSLALFQGTPTDNDLDYKQRVLSEFIDTALQGDLQIAREAVLYLMLNMDSLQNINLGKFLNQLLVKLLNSYSLYKYDLLGLIDNIVNGWFKHLNHSVMRALLVLTFYDLPERKVLEFFNLCVEVGIYKIHDGFDNSIEIPRNLLPEEILFVLHIHFHKICKSNFPLHNIVISMEQKIETDEYTHLIHIFTNSLVENHEMVTRILNVFGKFDHFPAKDKINITSGFITIPYEHLKHFFMPYRTGLPSITKFR